MADVDQSVRVEVMEEKAKSALAMSPNHEHIINEFGPDMRFYLSIG